MRDTNYIFSSSSTASDLSKKFKEAKSEELQGRANTKITITVLANFATQYLVNSIYTSLMFNGINSDIYESSFDQWEFELNNPESETNQRKSDYVLLLLSSTRLIPNCRISPIEFAEKLKKLIIGYKEKCRGEIILVLPESIREGFDQTSLFYQMVKDFKKNIQQELENLIHFVDIDPLIMEFGFEKWHSSKFLLSAKLCCHPNCFPLYGNYLSNFVQSLVRRHTRLIITDLDNTLWDGIVGEVGWEGIGLDKDSKGYPYIMLQAYLLSLKRAGVLLAICSKNTFAVAKEVFDKRREMILKYDDFVATEINWKPKSENITKILSDLNLTKTGVMFLDDSKFEREEVKNNLLDVIVPELSENAEQWCEILSKTGYLTVGQINEEDFAKSSMYLAEKKRKEDADTYADYSSFLNKLALSINPKKVSSGNFDRVFELVHKTNQFNLTTKRLTRKELGQLASRDDCFCYCHNLKDKYSDYGIISVFIAEKITNGWKINTWLMSCRAMGRGVENAVFSHFLSLMLTEGESVYGEYLKTEKNNPIAGLLEKMGFTQSAQNSTWSFTVGKNKNPQAEHISIV